MHAFLFRFDRRVENNVDRGGGPFSFIGMAGDVGFVNLDHVGVNLGDLFCQRARQRQRHVRIISVVMIHQRLREHMRPGQSEFHRMTSAGSRAAIIVEQHQRAFADLALDNAGWG
ncbi:MAG: hypothetical protein JMDDDDMK_03273 [Acidobacteria bacterium]|nr:hypothetical protein [Acidobacteriota bacterium]